jgi:hypothetical protein
MSLYLTGLSQWLRAAGLRVIEYDGWQTRARSSGGYNKPAPLCIMWHHTASNPSSDGQQDASYCAVGAEDAPLANIYIQRDGTVWVLAAGATNTNGKGKSLRFSRGTVPQDSMNSYAVGFEVANNGVGEQWPQAQVDAYFAASNAINAALGNRPDDIASHWEYAPDRKIDPATAPAVQGHWQPDGTNSSGSWNPDQIRQECNARADNQIPPPPPKDELMFTVVAVRDHGEALGGNMDGNGIIAQITWLNPNRYNACLQAGAPILTVSLNELANCDLLGPCPPSMNPGAFANHIE